MSETVDHDFPRWGYVSNLSEPPSAAASVETAGGAGPLVLSFHTSDDSTVCSSSNSSSFNGAAGLQFRSPPSNSRLWTAVQQLITDSDSSNSGKPGDRRQQGEAPERSGSSSDESTIAFRLPLIDLRDSSELSTSTSNDDDQSTVVGSPDVELSKAPPAATTAGDSSSGCGQRAPSLTGRCMAIAEFQKNWPSSEEFISQQSVSTSHSSQQPRPAGHSVRFAPEATTVSRRLRTRPVADLRRLAAASRFPAWLDPAGTNVANASNRANPTATAAPAAQAAKPIKKTDDEQPQSCLSGCSVLRCLGLIGYYLTLWTVGAGFTWLLLELSLMLTSRGQFPYYMSPHSFCLSSPGIGFPGGNLEPGKVTEFKSLASLNSTLISNLRDRFVKLGTADVRQCDSGSASTSDTELLMRPCNLTLFGQAAITQVQTLLKDRPAVIVQIKRHLGYLPATGSHVTISCKASSSGTNIPLRYHSWSGSKLIESDSSGRVPTLYFPMLSRWHNVPAVLVSLANADSAIWTGKELKIQCQAADGGGVNPPEREIILKVG